MFDRWSVVVQAGVVAAGMSAAMLAGAGVAAGSTDGGAGQSESAESRASTRVDSSDANPPAQTSGLSGGAAPTAGHPTDASATQSEPDDIDVSEEPGDIDVSEEAGQPDDSDEQGELDESAAIDETEDVAGGDSDESPASADGGESAAPGDGVAEGAAVEAETTAGGEVDDFASAGGLIPTVNPAEPASVADGVAAAEPVTEVASVDGETVADSVDADGVAVAEPATDAESVPVAVTVGDGLSTAEPPAEPGSVLPLRAATPLTMTAADDHAASQAAAPARQTLLSLLGTLVFNIYGGLIRVFGGPPQVPRGSTVTVRSSTVEIDCGEGYEVPADWYVPAGVTPQRLVYLQHGFLAAGPFYSYTAARLAEATNSIVVTTSLTSNFLACDGCWVGGSPMHRAVADLFADGNTALAESALAAGYSSTLLDGVDKVALTGHSAGGGLVAGAAGYMVGNGSIDRLAGVVMLDGVGFRTVVPDALAVLPEDVPLYNIAGRSYFWNLSGVTNAALSEARPDKFVGVRLVGGLHSDTMLGGNPLVQFALYLVTGFSREENIDAAEILNAAWINDMFAGQTTAPYYGQPGELLEIDTPRGTATAYVNPGPAERLSLFDHVITFFANIVFSIDFATCADEPAENVSFSGPDTLLSLDGRAKPGQSIGQHVCTG